MLFRTLAYVSLGWLLMAAVPAFASRVGLTVMLPATTAVLLAHLAFSRKGSLPWALAVATGLGYLEDLHQGAPLGTLALAHGLTFLGLRWAAARIALRGIVSRAMAGLVTIVAVDLCTFATLVLLADGLGFSRDSLLHSLWEVRWHVLATGLVAHPVWLLTDRVFQLLRLDKPRPGEEAEPAGRPSVVGK